MSSQTGATQIFTNSTTLSQFTFYASKYGLDAFRSVTVRNPSASTTVLIYLSSDATGSPVSIPPNFTITLPIQASGSITVGFQNPANDGSNIIVHVDSTALTASSSQGSSANQKTFSNSGAFSFSAGHSGDSATVLNLSFPSNPLLNFYLTDILITGWSGTIPPWAIASEDPFGDLSFEWIGDLSYSFGSPQYIGPTPKLELLTLSAYTATEIYATLMGYAQ